MSRYAEPGLYTCRCLCYNEAMIQNGRVPITNSLAIPESELRFRFSRSSGPGGQHVNRSATQVELLFDVAHSPSLSNEQRARILEALRTRIDREGVLHIFASGSRSQLQNRDQAIHRFQALLRRALHAPRARHPTRPSAAARERRLAAKRRRSQLKAERRHVPEL